MTDLFDQAPIPGLSYCNDLVPPDAQARLVERLVRLDLPRFQFHRWTGNRRTQSFGWKYDFGESRFSRTESIPRWLLPLRADVARFARLPEDDFEHALIARYDPGAGIGWHRDRRVFSKVAGVSLASSAIFRFRQRREGGFRRAQLELAPGSAYLLTGEARDEWEHSIAPGDSLRFSITFRTLAER